MSYLDIFILGLLEVFKFKRKQIASSSRFIMNGTTENPEVNNSFLTFTTANRSIPRLRGPYKFIAYEASGLPSRLLRHCIKQNFVHPNWLMIIGYSVINHAHTIE